MRLKFDGKVIEYHPATGMALVPGEAEYPEEHVDSLLATGRLHRVHPPKAEKAAAEKGKE